MEIGKQVVLEKFAGETPELFEAIVIAVQPESVSVAYFNPAKESVLGGVDWRLAFERVYEVKLADHADVIAGKEGFAYHVAGEVE